MSVDLEKLCLGCMRELPKGAHECLRCGWKKGGKKFILEKIRERRMNHV